MRKLYLWNKVFARVMDIKDEYLKTNQGIEYSDYPLNSNILAVMIDKIEDSSKRDFYLNWLNTLKINQNGSRILLHYDLMESAKEMWEDINSINIEARSIYIDLDTEDIVLCPMPKFFNIDEVKENKSDIIFEKIKNAKVFEISEKMDGSNQNATYFNGEVVLCGSSACDPEKSWRVVEGYNIIKSNIGYENMLKDNIGKTFIFELIHPEDNHVVYYDDSKTGLYLLCVRDNLTGRMSDYKEVLSLASKYNIPATKLETYTLDELLAAKSKFSANDLEGWVLNIDGYRVKFKTDDYLKMHKCFSAKSMTKLLIKEIADGTIDDFISTVPLSIKDKVLEHIKLIYDFVSRESEIVNNYYNSLKDIADRKLFAEKVNSEVPGIYRTYMFAFRDGKEVNVLKRQNRYIKPLEIGLKNLYLHFDENTVNDTEE